MSGFNSTSREFFDIYLNQIFNEYIDRVPVFLRNIAILDGENLLGYNVNSQGETWQIECGNSMYTPILEILNKAKAIDENTFIAITQKRNNNLCAIKELELIKGNPSVYIFVIEDSGVVVNINNEIVSLNVVRSITSKSYNLPKNHYIKGFDDFIGNYIFSYFYKLSKQEFKTINSVFYYSGDVFKDNNSYIKKNLPYHLVPNERSKFNGNEIISFDGFDRINIYSAKNNQIYQLINDEYVRDTLISADRDYSRETIKADDICDYFELQAPDKTVRICNSRVDLQIHILGNPYNTQNILQEIKNLFNPPISSYFPYIEPEFEKNEEQQVEWASYVPNKFDFKPKLKDDYYKKYMKYKTKYLHLNTHLKE